MMERIFGKVDWIHIVECKHYKEIKTMILSDSNLGGCLSWKLMWLAWERSEVTMGNYVAFRGYI